VRKPGNDSILNIHNLRIPGNGKAQRDRWRRSDIDEHVCPTTNEIGIESPEPRLGLAPPCQRHPRNGASSRFEVSTLLWHLLKQ
jgi:hypothetical protein